MTWQGGSWKHEIVLPLCILQGAMIEPRIEIVLPADPMAETLSFFREQLGLQLESIVPADDPQVAVLVGGGMRVQLRSDYDANPGQLQLTVAGDLPANTRAPNGTEIVYAPAHPPLVVPEPDTQPVISTSQSNNTWGTGRAGMLYRDLIPGRLSGHVIASHIRIPDGGPVPDNVHFHNVRFQMIYCYRGWARLVYEDQGEPFVMEAGDCVLQPPQIRHRVLEASDGLEVIEVGCPAVHLTTLDHQLELPTKHIRPGREFSGQRFHLHQQQNAEQSTDALTGWLMTDLGLAAATDQIADVTVLEAAKPAAITDDQTTFYFILNGSCDLTIDTQPAAQLAATDSATIPPNLPHTITGTPDTHVLRVRL